MAVTVYERITIGDRKFTVYERTSPRIGGRTQWDVWEHIDGRGIRRYGPGSRKRCYEYLKEIEGKRVYLV